MRVYEAIVKGLESADVGAAFGGAGRERRRPDAGAQGLSEDQADYRRHEQAAAFIACGYAMFTSKLGVCFATAGPGAFNLFSGLVGAHAPDRRARSGLSGDSGALSRDPRRQAGSGVGLVRRRRHASEHPDQAGAEAGR